MKLVRPKELHSSTARNTAPYPDGRAGVGDTVAACSPGPSRPPVPPPCAPSQPVSSTAHTAANAAGARHLFPTCIVIPPDTPVQRDSAGRVTPDMWAGLRTLGVVRRVCDVRALRPTR
ncbi:hypothetical protein GCM10010297_33910 [Streptomyces malachitofuscus]|nr:hypothetical protein GCM10010297_33910 [Streptomyces malachitofuscus]